MPPDQENPLEALSTYVRQVMQENNLTVNAVERQARKRGGTLGKSTVDGIIQGTTRNPGIFTLRELAWGLSRPVDEVIAVALGTSIAETQGFRKSDFANLHEGYTQLSKPDQRFFDRLLGVLDRELRRLLGDE